MDLRPGTILQKFSELKSSRSYRLHQAYKMTFPPARNIIRTVGITVTYRTIKLEEGLQEHTRCAAVAVGEVSHWGKPKT